MRDIVNTLTIPMPFLPLHRSAYLGSTRATIAFSYDIFAELRTSALPAYVASVADMIDAVVAWALPGALSRVPLDVLLTAVGALMCEYQVQHPLCV